VATSKEAGVSGWQDESRGESIESMEMGLGNDVEVRAGQMVSSSDDVERSKTVSGASPGYFCRKYWSSAFIWAIFSL
jgi:hypothetical protein|tara:strand:+ start:20443 stop:20673 length:231 start_codon:yes stop_codon:yes gene_type:complete